MSGEATGKPTAASGKPARGASASTPPAPPAPSVSSPPPSVPPKKAAGTPPPTSAAGATKVSGSGGAQGPKAKVSQGEGAKTAPSTRPGGTPAAKGPSPIGTVTAATPTSTAPSVTGAPASQGSSTAPARPSVTQAEPSTASTATTQSSPAVKKAVPGPRRVRLAVARIDPWSAMKLSFLLSIALGIMMIVATIVFWMVLDGMYVFTEVDRLVQEVLGDAADVNVLQYVEFKRVVSLATIIAIVDMVLLTALATIGAFLYNVVASLVGGVHLTLIDE